jgi:hypothetical protein
MQLTFSPLGFFLFLLIWTPIALGLTVFAAVACMAINEWSKERTAVLCQVAVFEYEWDRSLRKLIRENVLAYVPEHKLVYFCTPNPPLETFTRELQFTSRFMGEWR